MDKLLNQSTIESCNNIFQPSETVNNTVRNLADILSRYLPIKDDSDIRRAGLLTIHMKRLINDLSSLGMRNIPQVHKSIH